MLFKRIHFPPENSREEFSNWYLLLETPEEVERFFQREIRGYSMAMFAGVPLSEQTATHYDRNWKRLLDHAKASLREGETMWPHEVLSTFVNRKFLAILGHVLAGRAVQVNEFGGWCIHETFLKTWPTARVVNSLTQDSLEFPVQSEITREALQSFGI